jgi:hypothetical protein
MTKNTNCHTLVETLWDGAQVALKERRSAGPSGTLRRLVLLPSLTRSIMFCGMCLAPLGLPERVLVILNRAHAADPSDALVMTRLSEALYADGRFMAAEIAVRNALRGGVADGEGLFLLARTLWLQGSIDAAFVALDQAVRANSAPQVKRNIMEYTVIPGNFL